MSVLPRWVKRLAVSGARLRAKPDGSDGFAVFPQGDQRRRPVARVSAGDVRAAIAEGWLTGSDEAGYRLAHDAHDLAARQQGGFATAHRKPVRRAISGDDGRVGRYEVNMADSPLARWYRPRGDETAGWLTESEFEAGERLRADYHRSTLSERVTSDWDGYLAPSGSGKRRSPEDVPASALAAKERVQRALAVAGPGFDSVLSSVCLRESGLEEVEGRERWPRRSGKVVLKLALQRLCRFYGLPVEDELGADAGLGADACDHRVEPVRALG
ncbi:DUF6456 domain-containing protein [Hyphobacterium sp.]|uniref:DUF6456 domain-containing protein n=1 Tax=Hyphobacterium sp. TaxID=2004662 RepID=UPI003B52CE7F